MLYTITPADMKALETRFMQDHAVPGALLMEHAAQGIVAAIRRYTDRGTALFLCGPGNNGGDGLAAARLWEAMGGTSRVFAVTQALRGDALLNLQLLLMAGVPVASFDEPFELERCDVIVDALFGTGLCRPIADDDLAANIASVNSWSRATRTPVIAVDIPSGLNGETGRVMGCAIRATETVTFHRIKQGLLLGDAPDYVGRMTVQPILIPLSGDHDADHDGLAVLTPDDLTSRFRRAPTCHKGDLGRVVLFCGSAGMAGAAALCANAALRTGAGLVSILCRESILPVLQTLAPGATCTVLPEENGRLTSGAIPLIRESLHRADAACIGCGLGLTDDLLPVLPLFKEAECPVLWDADALTLLSRTPGMLPLKAADVITPHPGEAARLLGCATASVTADALTSLARLRDLCGCTVLLKGARTLVTDGAETWCNLYASPALAKGGSGDVLAGIIAALLARKMPQCPGDRLSSGQAAAFGALIHGLAGIRAAKAKGENCTLPTDIVDCIRLDGEGVD